MENWTRDPWCVCIVCTLHRVIDGCYLFKELKTCLRELSLVDNTLEALGTPKEYRRLYKWMIGVIVIWVVSSNFLNIMDVLWEISLTNHDFVDICIMLGGNIILHIGTINGAISGTILGLVYILSQNFSGNEQRTVNLNKCRRDIRGWQKFFGSSIISSAQNMFELF